jgi:hypothetical protein
VRWCKAGGGFFHNFKLQGQALEEEEEEEREEEEIFFIDNKDQAGTLLVS